MLRLPLVVVLLLLAPLAFAQIYTWTDAGGTVHFSEAPPATGIHYKQIKINGSAVPVADTSRTAADATAHNGDDPASAAHPQPPLADTPANRSKLCAQLTTNLTTLRGTTPVVMKQDGKDVALADSQRQAQLNAAQAQYRQYCQSPQ